MSEGTGLHEDVPIREHLEAQMSERREVNRIRFDAHERALEIQSSQTERRFEKLDSEVHQLRSDSAAIFARLDTLKTLLEERDKRHDGRLQEQKEATTIAFNNAKQLVDAVFKASETAIQKAENAQAAYNARSNEFRDALDDANKNNIPRHEAERWFSQLTEKIESMRSEFNDKNDSLRRESSDKLDSLRAERVTVTASLESRISELQSYVDRLQGRGQGTAAMWAALVAGGSILIGVASVVIAVISRGP